MQNIPIDSHYLDISLPNGYATSIKLSQETTGQDIIDIAAKYQFQQYVICRMTSSNNSYEVLYTSENHDIITPLITRDEPFSQTKLSTIFIPGRYVTSQFQRNTFYVFLFDEFIRRYNYSKLPTNIGSILKPKNKIRIRVQISTGLIFNIKIHQTQTIDEITKTIYHEMEMAYGKSNLNVITCYKFGTVNGYFPEQTARFDSDLQLVSALRVQRLRKDTFQFVYSQIPLQGAFAQYADRFIGDLDLVRPKLSFENQALNASVSQLRKTIDINRSSIMAQNPLFNQIRTSKTDPPLDTFKEQFKLHHPDKTPTVAMKAELRSGGIEVGAQSIAINISYKSTAEEAIQTFFTKLQRLSVCADRTADEFVLNLRGTDEVIAGNVPLKHFVCIRQFLLSGSGQVLNLLLIEKKQIVQQVQEREAKTPSLPEPNDEELLKPISLIEAPPLSFRQMGGIPHSSIKDFLSVTIHSVYLPQPKKKKRYTCQVAIINGTQTICGMKETKPFSGARHSALVNETLTFTMPIQNIPRTARLSFTLIDYVRSSKGKKSDLYVGTYNSAIFSFDGWLDSGMKTRKLWPKKGLDYFLTTCECNADDAIDLEFSLPQFRFPVSFIPAPIGAKERKMSAGIPPEDMKRVEMLQDRDLLQPITQEERALLWKYRYNSKLNQNPVLADARYWNT